MNAEQIAALIAEVEGAKAANNFLDVRIECALFKPNGIELAIRPNAAGTKVIYTDNAGKDLTCWAADWTLSAERRKHTADRLRALLENQP